MAPARWFGRKAITRTIHPLFCLCALLAVMWSHKLVAGPHQLLKTPLLHIHSPVDLDVWVGIHDHPAVSGCVLGTRVNEGRHVNAHVGTNSGIVRAIIKSAGPACLAVVWTSACPSQLAVCFACALQRMQTIHGSASCRKPCSTHHSRWQTRARGTAPA